jgi:hypothetical protein
MTVPSNVHISDRWNVGIQEQVEGEEINLANEYPPSLSGGTARHKKLIC